jgi:hypothetical protein
VYMCMYVNMLSIEVDPVDGDHAGEMVIGIRLTGA